MNIKFFLPILFLLFISNFALAHNTQQSSFNLVLDGDESFLDISLSQYGVEQALLSEYPMLNLRTMSQKAFKELLVRHIKENTELSVNGDPLVIGGGMIKLTSHQSKLRLNVTGADLSPQTLSAKISCFQKNDRQTNILKVNHKGLSTRAQLSQKNDFQTKVMFKQNQLVLADKSEKVVSGLSAALKG